MQTPDHAAETDGGSYKESNVDSPRRVAGWHPNVVVKIPIDEAGLEATSRLSKEGVKVNMTLVFSANQALLAAHAGATYISPFVGRLDDVGHDGMAVVADSVISKRAS